jgi:hypothetical protein
LIDYLAEGPEFQWRLNFANSAQFGQTSAAREMKEIMTTRECLRPPIPEIADAARYLDAAVSAHLAGRSALAHELIQLADADPIRQWTDSIWGANSPYVLYRATPGAPPLISSADRAISREPTTQEKAKLLARDGYHCRFCGIPVIRAEVRQRICDAYPQALTWGKQNSGQHAAFQAMWAQYDHVVPHARGGASGLDNLLVTCAPCNFGRMSFTLEEVGLVDPRTRDSIHSDWDGLERFHCVGEQSGSKALS